MTHSCFFACFLSRRPCANKLIFARVEEAEEKNFLSEGIIVKVQETGHDKLIPGHSSSSHLLQGWIARECPAVAAGRGCSSSIDACIGWDLLQGQPSTAIKTGRLVNRL